MGCTGSKAEFTVFSTPFCPEAQAVKIGLLAKGCNFTVEYVDPLHKPEWYLKHALHGEGPVLQYGKEVAGGVAECLKLLDKAKHEAPVLMRDGVDAIMPLVESIQPIFLEFLRNRAPDKQVEITERLNERLSEISEQLKGPFMLGEEFSAADCLLLAWMERVVEIGKTFEEKKWTWEAVAQSEGADFEKLKLWYDKCVEKFNTPNGREEVEQMLDWYRPELIPGPAYCVMLSHTALRSGIMEVQGHLDEIDTDDTASLVRVHHAVLDWLHAAQLHDKMEDSVLFPWLETKKEGITKEFSKEHRKLDADEDELINRTKLLPNDEEGVLPPDFDLEEYCTTAKDFFEKYQDHIMTEEKQAPKAMYRGAEEGQQDVLRNMFLRLTDVEASFLLTWVFQRLPPYGRDAFIPRLCRAVPEKAGLYSEAIRAGVGEQAWDALYEKHSKALSGIEKAIEAEGEEITTASQAAGEPEKVHPIRDVASPIPETKEDPTAVTVE